MTITSTSTTVAKYIRKGKIIFFKLRFSGTLGGTPSNTVYFTLPVTGAASNEDTFACFLLENAATKSGVSVVDTPASKAAVYRYDLANMTAGAFATTVCGFYEVA